MKKIINGKIYDTDTAKRVGYWDNGCYGNDFHACEEDLYQKRTGEFFLHGFGGAMSKYAESCGNGNWGGGQKIIPLTYDAAKYWAEEHLKTEVFEDIFGEVAEDDSKTQLCISISTTAAEKAKRAAAAAGITLSAYIESMIG